MKKHPKIAVIILNFNGAEHTMECLSSVRESTYELLTIIVVDNASTDDSISKLKQFLCSSEQLIEYPINGGYSLGNNIGMEDAFMNGAQYVLVINNDIILDRNCIELLYQAVSQDETIGIIGPKILYYSKPDIINYAGISGSIHFAKYNRIGLNETDNDQYEGLVDTLYQEGSALLISKACYEKVGGFDEALWAYSEDFDICMRARLAGFRVCCLQKARIWHKISASFGGHSERKPHAIYYGVRNSYIFHRRYAGSLIKKICVVLILLSRMPRRIVSILLKEKRSRVRNLWMLVVATLVGITTDIHQPSDAFAPNKVVNRICLK